MYVSCKVSCGTLSNVLDTATKINGPLTTKTKFVSPACTDLIISLPACTNDTRACMTPITVTSLSSELYLEYIGFPA